MGSEKSHLSIDDACRILGASAKAGVIELKFGDLHVKFGRPAENVEVRAAQAPQTFMQQEPPVTAPVKALTDEQHTKLAALALEQSELQHREDQLARALVEDPMLYEELLRQGDLSDELDGADHEDDE